VNAARTKLVTRTLLLASLALLAARASHAQESFEVRDALRDYVLKVRVADCGREEHVCAGPAQVQIFKKGAAVPAQSLSLPSVEVYRETVAHNPETNPKPRGLYAEEYSFVGEDFNFDGLEDLAVCNGRNGGYGGPSYDVFLFDRASRKFVASGRLSELTEGPYLGLFFADRKKRRLTAHSKSGCCYHETDVFRLVNNHPVLVEKVVEDATHTSGAGEGFVVVTTKKRVNGRWVVSRRRRRLER
jgi:hypothetical protein